MNAHQLEVKSQKPCLLGLHIPYKPKMKKRLCVIPIMKRISNLEDDLTVSLWFYNDDKLEYDVSNIHLILSLLICSRSGNMDGIKRI